MRHRLSPRDTTLVKILGAAAGEERPSSDAEPAAIACAGCNTAFSCGFAAFKGGWGDGAARDPVSGTYSVRDCVAPELAPTSFTVTVTPCLDDATVPSGNLAFNVNS